MEFNDWKPTLVILAMLLLIGLKPNSTASDTAAAQGDNYPKISLLVRSHQQNTRILAVR